jgi:hypothetical protein
LGADGSEHGVTATLVRRLSKNLRLTCKYGYYQYDDGTYGGNRDYDAHVLYSSLQYRFYTAVREPGCGWPEFDLSSRGQPREEFQVPVLSSCARLFL